jgi:hypothetical protein
MNFNVVSISNSAKKYISENDITHVTFKLTVLKPSGSCCLRVVKEIEPIYEKADNLANYYQTEIEGIQVYIARQLRIYAPVKLVTEGFSFFKRLALNGVTVTI